MTRFVPKPWQGSTTSDLLPHGEYPHGHDEYAPKAHDNTTIKKAVVLRIEENQILFFHQDLVVIYEFDALQFVIRDD